MAEESSTLTPEQFSNKLVEVMADALKAYTSPEMMQAQIILLRRLALEGDVVPSRLPAPKNITEVGGYLNLLEELSQQDLRMKMLSSVLGVAGPAPMLELLPGAPVLFFAARPNDRPTGPGQAAIPVQYSLRSDFIPALDAAMKQIHDLGCQMPVLSPMRILPSAIAGMPPFADMLSYIGRTLDLAPSAALVDPDIDTLALARLTAGGNLQVVARQLDVAAPRSAEVVQADWTAWKCTAVACQEIAGMRTYLPLEPILNPAGWYQAVPSLPQTLSKPGNWAHWTNITGLVAGVTRYGDELGYLYTRQEIVASALRDRLDWVWDGQTFVASAP